MPRPHRWRGIDVLRPWTSHHRCSATASPGRCNKVDQPLDRTHQLGFEISERINRGPQARPKPLQRHSNGIAETLLERHTTWHIGPRLQPHHSGPHPCPHVHKGMTGDENVRASDTRRDT